MADNIYITKDGKMRDEGRRQTAARNIAFRSEEAQDILSRQPGFAEKWSLFIFLFILVALMACTYFIKYPDVIQANATLTAANAPKEIVIRQDGKLVRLFAANDGIVKQGQTIGWIESTANHANILQLSSLLETYNSLLARNETQKLPAIFGNGLQNLGELQPAYQQFFTAWQQFDDYLINGYYCKKKNGLFESKVYLQKIHASLERQVDLTKQDITLTQEAFEANDTLYRDKVISKQDLRDQKSKLVGKQLTVPQLESTLLSNENDQAEKQKEIDELEHTISQQKVIFQQALQTFKSLIDDWKRRYIISSPVDGKVVFIVPLEENQFMQSGKTIGYINPPDTRYYAQIILPQHNFGKIEAGEKVQLRFDAYPYQEFGFIRGKLKYISKVPTDSGFLATIELPEGLVTNYQKTIQYRNGLKSQALVITKSSRLMQRFVNTIISGTHTQ